ncbi:hypothetical protein J6590_081740 [Homalodisca vitripennis]|nr:hypothetical protein J6590_081740 [Homalodisca vitripennis]
MFESLLSFRTFHSLEIKSVRWTLSPPTLNWSVGGQGSITLSTGELGGRPYPLDEG